MRALFFLLVLSGCNAIFSIDEARLDPNAAGDGGDPNAVSCENYCRLMTQNCKGANLEYSDETKCRRLCDAFDTGTPGKTGENTLACRQAFAVLAKEDPEVNCEKAGPLSGGGACVAANCGSFCFLNRSFCSGIAGGFLNDQACSTDCLALPYNPNVPMAGDTDKKTLNCRLYHLEVAIGGDEGSPIRRLHCGHTGGDAVCNQPPP
jgi:hypothetical protein